MPFSEFRLTQQMLRYLPSKAVQLMFRVLAILITLPVVAVPTVAADSGPCTKTKFATPGDRKCVPHFKCEGDKRVTGKCFVVHGRLEVGLDFKLRLAPDGRENFYYWFSTLNGYIPLPTDLADALDLDNYILGDFRVCPWQRLDEETETACIESATNIEVHQEEKTCWGSIGAARANKYNAECVAALGIYYKACDVYQYTCPQVIESVRQACAKLAADDPNNIPSVCREDPAARLAPE